MKYMKKIALALFEMEKKEIFKRQFNIKYPSITIEECENPDLLFVTVE